VPESQKLKKWSISQPGVETLNYSVTILVTLELTWVNHYNEKANKHSLLPKTTTSAS